MLRGTAGARFFFAMLIGGGAMTGCIGAPGIPGGPLQGTGVSLSGSWGYALAPARIGMRSTRDGQPAQYQDPAADALNFPLFPGRLGGRVGITKWFDAAGDLNLMDSGFELRAGLPEGTQPFPIALSLSARRGAWGLLTMANRDSTDQRLRLEIYPRLARLPRGARINLISTLGVSTGRRFHPSQLPNRFERRSPEDEDGEGPMIPVPDLKTFHTYVYRDETRVEGSLGFEMRQDHFFSSLVLMPYVLANSEAPTGVCRDCGDWEIGAFHSNFGAALFLSIGVSFVSEPSD